MIKIIESLVSEKWDEVEELLTLHVNELTTRKDIMKLNPDKERYKLLEDEGVLFALFVYDDDKLIGYSVNGIGSNLHYADLIMAQSDVLYLHPDYRKKEIGKLLITETELLAREKGADVYLLNAKPDTPLAYLLPNLGYSIQDIVHMKVL
jgi:GNAT superfamily N-acetyltransferase